MPIAYNQPIALTTRFLLHKALCDSKLSVVPLPQPHLGMGLLRHLLHQIPWLSVEGHQRKLPRQSDCGNLLLKVGWELGVILRRPPGGDVDVVPAEAENGVPPGWGEGVPLAEEGVRFLGK